MSASSPSAQRPNRARRLRPASLAAHGGASSLLRLAQPAATGLPSGNALGQWVRRAASTLGADMVSFTEFSSPQLVTPLDPSPELAWR
jgi:hypothetical protein